MTDPDNVPPINLYDKFVFLLSQLLNPWIVTAIIFTFLSGLSWMLAMTKFDLSYAYSFLGLNFVITLIVGVSFFNEPLLLNRVIGVLVIGMGIILVAKA